MKTVTRFSFEELVQKVRGIPGADQISEDDHTYRMRRLAAMILNNDHVGPTGLDLDSFTIEDLEAFAQTGSEQEGDGTHIGFPFFREMEKTLDLAAQLSRTARRREGIAFV